MMTLERAMELDNHECGNCGGFYSYHVLPNWIEGTCSSCGTGVDLTHAEYIEAAQEQAGISAGGVGDGRD